jgi:hypothetical protein
MLASRPPCVLAVAARPRRKWRQWPLAAARRACPVRSAQLRYENGHPRVAHSSPSSSPPYARRPPRLTGAGSNPAMRLVHGPARRPAPPCRRQHALTPAPAGIIARRSSWLLAGCGGQFEIAQNALKAPLVPVVLFPAPKVANIALVAQLDRPSLTRVHHLVVKADWK